MTITPFLLRATRNIRAIRGLSSSEKFLFFLDLNMGEQVEHNGVPGGSEDEHVPERMQLRIETQHPVWSGDREQVNK